MHFAPLIFHFDPQNVKMFFSISIKKISHDLTLENQRQNPAGYEHVVLFMMWS